MGLLTIIKKVKQKEKEIRVLMVYVGMRMDAGTVFPPSAAL
jgi:hypothetical protein